jgi:hypothetical protein
MGREQSMSDQRLAKWCRFVGLASAALGGHCYWVALTSRDIDPKPYHLSGFALLVLWVFVSIKFNWKREWDDLLVILIGICFFAAPWIAQICFR